MGFSYEDAMLNVKAGAQFLDKEYGSEWVNWLDVDSLDLRDSCNCVVGQLEGMFAHGCIKLGLDPYRHEDKKVIDLGFFAPDKEYFYGMEDDWETLTQAWRDYVTERRS